LVVLVGMQQDLWPDLRTSSSLLQAERLGVDGLEQPLTRRQILDDERRLAFVAATRARSRLVISCVESQLPDQPQPSLFIDELRARPGIAESNSAPAGGAGPKAVRVPSRLTPSALTASLRTALMDPEASPALRTAAAERLARWARRPARPLRRRTPQWWGIRDLSRHRSRWWRGEPVCYQRLQLPSVSVRCGGSWIVRG
jgi:ATP-dependent exoDNAse (exonuclease V) beta subunit